MQNTSSIVYHKQATSAKITFLRLNGTVCQCEGLPSTSKVIASTLEGKVNPPETLVTELEQKLQLPSGMLAIESEFQATVEGENGTIEVYMVAFTSTDAPHPEVAEIGGKLIAITEARTLPPVELELLRLAYAFLMDD